MGNQIDWYIWYYKIDFKELADWQKRDSRELIQSGVFAKDSAKGTEYERQYHDYWNPIMQEHQKKVDEMK